MYRISVKETTSQLLLQVVEMEDLTLGVVLVLLLIIKQIIRLQSVVD